MKELNMRMSIVLILCATAGCATISAGHAAYAKLTSAEKEDLRNCQTSIQQHQCGSNSRTVADDALATAMLGSSGGSAVCLNGLIAAYAESSDKKRWLIKNGCPRDMVE
jgi:hypothetical protein